MYLYIHNKYTQYTYRYYVNITYLGCDQSFDSTKYNIEHNYIIK